MCGIVGVVAHGTGHIRADEIRSMVGTVEHRGPDFSDVWVGDTVGFGHTRLSILDLREVANQPLITIDGTGVLVYNGEIYNHLALREELEAEGVEFTTRCDSEVVLLALHHWGVEPAVKRFNGMFAFAYTDLRNGSTWLARDRLGIKPLFIGQVGDMWLFASEQKGLLAHPAMINEVDGHAFHSLLTYERFHDKESPYVNVENFLPGHCLEIRDGEHHWSCYFDPIRDCDLQEICDTSKNLNYQIQSFEQSLEESVQAHLMSDVPLAVLCSGGLDSGLVTAMAAKHSSDLSAYVADMVGMQGEEYRRAKLITDHVGIDLKRVEINQQNFLSALPYAIRANDQPLFFAQEVALWLISEKMRADGIKVCLSGDGADELFGGYPWHEKEYKRWQNLSRKNALIPNNKLFHALGRIWSKLRPVNIDREIEKYHLTGQAIEYVATSLNVVFTAGMSRTLRQRRLFKHFEALPFAERAFLASNFEDIHVHMRECLNAKDKMMMWHGIEGRPPFIENSLIELGINLPVKHKYHRGRRKLLINSVAPNWLPAEVLNLPKIGFTAPPVLWRGVADQFIENGRVAERLGWPKNRMSEIYEILRLRPYYEFRLLCTEIWLAQFEDNMDPQELVDELLWTAIRNKQ
ncbi:MAG: asparagine synthase (glutamine-hydrolyzing) [Pseudomonadota bacterium]